MRGYMRNAAKDERGGLWQRVDHDLRVEPEIVVTYGKGGLHLARALTYSLPCPRRVLPLL